MAIVIVGVGDGSVIGVTVKVGDGVLVGVIVGVAILMATSKPTMAAGVGVEAVKNAIPGMPQAIEKIARNTVT